MAGPTRGSHDDHGPVKQYLYGIRDSEIAPNLHPPDDTIHIQQAHPTSYALWKEGQG
jgi:hypothetical protein